MSQDRETHPPAASTDQYGQRQYSPEPQATDIVRNFGDDYGTIYDQPATGGTEG